jgi:hypothetical protein
MRTPPPINMSKGVFRHAHTQRLADFADMRIIESRVAQSAFAFVPVAEPEEWRPRGQRNIQSAVRLNGFEDHCESDGLVRRRPDTKSNPAARAEYSRRLG